MCISKQDYLHGLVLALILKHDADTKLKLVEKNAGDHRATYLWNDDIALTILHRGGPRKNRYGTSWTFQISEDVLAHRTLRPHTALVCTSKTIGSEQECVCLLTDEQLTELFPPGESCRTVTIRKPKRGKLRVIHQNREKFKIAQNAILHIKMRP